MKRLISWWRQKSELNRVLIAFILSFGLLVASVPMIINELNSSRASFTEGIPFSRQGWITNKPFGSRLAMAKYLSRNRTLRGMSEGNVRKLLVFGQYRNDYEVHEDSNTIILVMNLSGPSSWGNFYVTIQDGKVVEESFFED